MSKTESPAMNPFDHIPTSVEELHSLCKKQVKEIDDEDQATFTKSYADKSYDRYFWEDGAGNEATIIFPHAGGAFLFGYDHESDLNTYGNSPQEKQVAFDGMPEEYKQYVDDGSLYWDWDDTNMTYATCAGWLIEGKWEYNSLLYKSQEVTAMPYGGLSYLFEFLI